MTKIWKVDIESLWAFPWNIVIFHSYVNVYQRVYSFCMLWCYIIMCTSIVEKTLLCHIMTLMWAKQYNATNHPAVIIILKGGMFAIPSLGWLWHCFIHIANIFWEYHSNIPAYHQMKSSNGIIIDRIIHCIYSSDCSLGTSYIMSHIPHGKIWWRYLLDGWESPRSSERLPIE